MRLIEVINAANGKDNTAQATNSTYLVRVIIKFLIENLSSGEMLMFLDKGIVYCPLQSCPVLLAFYSSLSLGSAILAPTFM